MKKKTYILLSIFILIFFAKEAKPQQPDSLKYFKLGINSGLYNLGSIDELYSPYLYSGKAVSYGLKMMDGNNRKNHQLEFRYAFINRTPKNININPALFPERDFQVMKESFIFEAVDQYRYLITKWSTNKQKIYLTGTWQTMVNINTNANSLPELIQTGLGAGIYTTRQFNKHKVVASFSVPLIALTVRNNYSLSMTQDYEKLSEMAFIKQNAQIQSLHNLWSVDAGINYTYQFSNKFSAEANYLFRYINNSSPRPLRSTSGIYTLGLIYQFR